MKARAAAAIEVRALRKQFGKAGVVALEDVSLSIAPGEFVSVLGPSGCGKSTLLRCIAGLEIPSAGSITVNGAPVDGPPAGLGMVFQRDALLDWRNVADNLMLPVDFRRGDRAASVWRSAGRWSTTRCCCSWTPFGALDALTRDQMNIELQKMWRAEHKTVVFVTHSISEAIFLGDRVVVFTPRPGRMADVVQVDLPRPRRLAVRGSERFNGYASHIRTLFEGMGLLKEEA